MSTLYDDWIDICYRIVSTVNQSQGSMEWCYFLGCIMIAFCAPFAILVFIIAPKPQLIVLSFSSSIFYLLGIMINAVIWKLVKFLQSSATIYIMISVLVIEFIRPVYFNYFNIGRRSFRTVSTNRVIFPLDDLTSSIASGYGWGLVHIFIHYIPYVAKSQGPGTYYSAECAFWSVITQASLMSHCVFLQHIFLMIIFYDAITKKSNLQWWFAVFLHLFGSLWNELQVPCPGIILGQFAMAVAEGIWTWTLIHKPKFRRKLKQI